MTMGMPAGYPGYQNLPASPMPLSAAPISSVASVDDSVWLGVGVVAAGVVASFGLLGFLAVSNSRDHEEIRREVGAERDQRLNYQRDHAIEHAAIAEAQARADASLQGQIDELRHRSHRGATLVAAPANIAPAVLPASLVTRALSRPPSAPSPTVGATPFPSLAHASVHPTLVGGYPSAAPVYAEPDTLVQALPPYLEDAVTQVMSRRPSAHSTSRRISHVPTLVNGYPS